MSNGRLFPTLSQVRVAQVDLNKAAQHWFSLNERSRSPNLLLDPRHTQDMISELHQRLAVDWSWGSYLEDRRDLLAGSYLDQSAGYLHLGIDCNVAAGTPVVAPCEMTTLHLFDDKDAPQGWGPRIILSVDSGSRMGEIVVLAHLAPLSHAPGTTFAAGELIGVVGAPPFNGFWFPHLHIQCLSSQSYSRHEINDFAELDGYGHSRDRDSLSRDYPNPLWLIAHDISAVAVSAN